MGASAWWIRSFASKAAKACIDYRVDFQLMPPYQGDNQLHVPSRINHNPFTALITRNNITVD
jgi:hypothetical protein